MCKCTQENKHIKPAKGQDSMGKKREGNVVKANWDAVIDKNKNKTYGNGRYQHLCAQT